MDNLSEVADDDHPMGCTAVAFSEVRAESLPAKRAAPPPTTYSLDDTSEIIDEDCHLGYTVVAEDCVVDALPKVSAEAHPGKRGRTSQGHYGIMLDGFLCPLEVGNLTGLTLIEGKTSKGENILVGFSVVEPPLVSRLFYTLHLKQEKPGCSSGDENGSWTSEAKAVAADGDCIVLRFLIVDVPEEEYDSDTGELINDREVREELLVYRAVPLSLIALPRCGHARVNVDMRNTIGIQCHKDGHFVVAHLIMPRKCSSQSECPMTADLCYISNKDSQWRTANLPILNAEEQCHLKWWVTDTVVTFGQYICWTDCLRGSLMCDISRPCLQIVYVPLPIQPYWGDIDKQSECRGSLSAYRSVCVTDDGKTLKFIDVSLDSCWFNSSQPRHAVSIWRMTMARNSFEWVLDSDSCLELKEVVALTEPLNLKCAQLEYPLVDRKSPHFVYFALIEKASFSGKAYLLKVDMRKKDLAKAISYKVGSLCYLGADVYKCTSSCNLFNLEAFLTCEFSKYLDLDEHQARQNVRGFLEASEFSMLQPPIMDCMLKTAMGLVERDT